MYSKTPGLVFGFHGCDQSVADKVIKGTEDLKKSENSYDWLGHGVYFWENDYNRAFRYAHILKDNSRLSKGKINQPSVIGAIIDLDHCLNLQEINAINTLSESYKMLVSLSKQSGNELPENKRGNGGIDLLLRYLDCAVIENLHTYRKLNDLRPFDSIRGVFQEGDVIYPNAGFREKTHIQICVRNSNCIKGYFVPRIDI